MALRRAAAPIDVDATLATLAGYDWGGVARTDDFMDFARYFKASALMLPRAPARAEVENGGAIAAIVAHVAAVLGVAAPGGAAAAICAAVERGERPPADAGPVVLLAHALLVYYAKAYNAAARCPPSAPSPPDTTTTTTPTTTAPDTDDDYGDDDEDYDDDDYDGGGGGGGGGDGGGDGGARRAIDAIMPRADAAADARYAADAAAFRADLAAFVAARTLHAGPEHTRWLRRWRAQLVADYHALAARAGGASGPRRGQLDADFGEAFVVLRTGGDGATAEGDVAVVT